MNTQKTRLVGIAALGAAAALALAGCSGAPASNGAGGDGDVTLRLAHVYEAAHPVETCGVKTLQDELDGSGITVKSFPAAQLGSEAEALEQVATGALDIAVAGSSFLGTWYEPAAVFDAAYLFDDVEHFNSTLNSDLMAGVFDELASQSGLRVQSGWYYGTRHVTANKEISSPADMKGLKIRTPDAPMYLKNTEVMGGTATPMALSEVYLGLQQGVIEAQENPLPTIATAKLNEVQKVVNLTGHMVQGVFLTTQESLGNRLSAEQNASFTAALESAAAAVQECVETQESEIIATWSSDGSIAINDAVKRDEFAKAAVSEFSKNPVWGELYSDIRAGK
ncbi:DctP family TRAP transporter solute-binding subunit [Leucobacter aridicollis]|uniref:Tripartite ATP-independent transporter DctP family solute receptor n=1 Tax=Leucobacter aridicollis TaxID=283878 RepID=A0A852R5X5_9MICO|nr:DctP family TRAP transporter solute-binding subunit [Leucobacter aridicollis]MBL3680785.1 DctP family TRAP transporter solute-binding subunit [Leucobacter aridicollis]NYD28227.1 tripartite ATP-independent transporter DctP family solute receptor [Leucobacter aridicollis]